MEYLTTLLGYSNFAVLDSLTKFALLVLFYVGPFFFIPMLMQRAGGMFSTLTGVVNDKSKGLFDRNRKWRSGMRKQNLQEALEDRSRRKSRGAKGVQEMARRVTMARQGGLSFNKERRAEYLAARKQLIQANAEKSIESDKGRNAGNDELQQLIARGKGDESTIRSDYVEKLVAGGMSEVEAEKRATEDIASWKAGHKIGDLKSGTARVTAFRSLLGSNTSLKGDDYVHEMMDMGAELINKGWMTDVDVAMAIKSNKMRGERAAMSASELISQLRVATKNKQNKRDVFYDEEAVNEDGTRGAVTDGMKQTLMNTVMDGADPGQLLGGRAETVEIMAPFLVDKMQQAMARGDESETQKYAAVLASWKDLAPQISPKKNDAVIKALKTTKDNAGNILPDGQTQPITVTIPGTNKELTIHQYMEAMRQGQYVEPELDDKGNQLYDEQFARDEAGRVIRDKITGANKKIRVPRMRVIPIASEEFNTRRRELGYSPSQAQQFAANQELQAQQQQWQQQQQRRIDDTLGGGLRPPGQGLMG